MKIVVCDTCNEEIKTEQWVEIMVRDGDEWFPLDLCSGSCVLTVFGLGETDEHGFEEQEEDEMMTLINGDEEEDDPPAPLTMDDRMANEKLFKEQASELSSFLGVKNRSKGER